MTTKDITRQRRILGGHLSRWEHFKAFKCRVFQEYSTAHRYLLRVGGTFLWQRWKVCRLSPRMRRQMEARPS